ncbi:hypothetical protein EX30DRAFT_397826 [Ascodesmis nigricans]|uniref:Uncharacterized protein n=1 Tax=Ascodesmis nigricans TaxID=341454 RepID=A0A4S2MMR8_9PEZI|nr:hypothetical protein EX30DRAFT_397826 [Ascodesmis nigricans]
MADSFFRRKRSTSSLRSIPTPSAPTLLSTSLDSPPRPPFTLSRAHSTPHLQIPYPANDFPIHPLKLESRPPLPKYDPPTTTRSIVDTQTSRRLHGSTINGIPLPSSNSNPSSSARNRGQPLTPSYSRTRTFFGSAPQPSPSSSPWEPMTSTTKTSATTGMMSKSRTTNVRITITSPIPPIIETAINDELLLSYRRACDPQYTQYPAFPQSNTYTGYPVPPPSSSSLKLRRRSPTKTPASQEVRKSRSRDLLRGSISHTPPHLPRKSYVEFNFPSQQAREMRTPWKRRFREDGRLVSPYVQVPMEAVEVGEQEGEEREEREEGEEEEEEERVRVEEVMMLGEVLTEREVRVRVVARETEREVDRWERRVRGLW